MRYYNQLIATLDKKTNNQSDEEFCTLSFDFRQLANSFERGGAVALMRLNTLIDYGWMPKSHLDTQYTANSHIQLTHRRTTTKIRLTGDGVVNFVNSLETDPILPDQSRYFQSFVETIGPAPEKLGIPIISNISPSIKKFSGYITPLGLFVAAIVVILLDVH